MTGGLERLETSGNLNSSGRGRPSRTCSARPAASVAPVGGAAAFDVGGIGRGGGEAPRTGRGDAEGVVGRWLPAVDLEPPLLAASLSDGQCVWHVYEDLGQPSLEHQADAEALESLRGADAALTEEQAALRDCLLADVATR